MSIVMSDLIKMDGLHKMIEAAYREGFSDGADHGNLDWKYPPVDVAWLMYRRNVFYPLGPCILTREQLKAIQTWEDQSYDQRTDAANKIQSAEESDHD